MKDVEKCYNGRTVARKISPIHTADISEMSKPFTVCEMLRKRHPGLVHSCEVRREPGKQLDDDYDHILYVSACVPN
jgi:hypothetical protein